MNKGLLLESARILSVLGRAICIFGALVLGVGLLFVAFGGVSAFDAINAEMVEAGAPVSGRFALALVFGTGFVILLLGERFLQQLQKIIASLPDGDPFIDENAARLERMGWLALAMQVMGLLTTIYSFEVERLASALEINSDVSIEGVFLVLILFILARVFRHGAAMREDLEGTV